MRHQTCCFTGHRMLPAYAVGELLARLEREVDALIARGVTDFVSGGALGFDQMAARLIVSKRRGNRNLRLIFALPCKEQDVRWPDAEREAYWQLLAEADEIHYVSENYSKDCMRKRNLFMVERSQYCVCAMMRVEGGTAQTVRYAHRQGLTVRNIAE